MQVESFQYDNKTVRNFAIATIIWGVVGMTVGLWVALQLVYPTILNLQPYFNFGRIRPLHTNAVIFAFVGNAMFMGVYYSLQRLLKARMFSDVLSKIHFWGWQLIIVAVSGNFIKEMFPCGFQKVFDRSVILKYILTFFISLELLKQFVVFRL